MFIDEAVIIVAGGGGGDGCLSFRREKFVPRGGPDGGDGGNGGSVLLLADLGVSTLLAFRYKSRYMAERGRHGQGSKKAGRSGQDLVVRVPVGTLVSDRDGTRALADLSVPGQSFTVAQGGRGGRGNARFASPSHRAPTRHDPGRPGEAQTVRLELKLLADVGLVGFPNAGKSTLISRISAARPKIADYPFTTLEPHLGVVNAGDYRSFVVADIPGLIEGAHQGAGLGDRFLRHLERCALLLHLVDPTSGQDPIRSIDTIRGELEQYGSELATRPQILILTKADAVQDASVLRQVVDYAEARGLPYHIISAVTGEGIRKLIRDVLSVLDRIRASAATEKENLR